MGYANLYAKAIKNEAKRKDNVSIKEELWLEFFRKLPAIVPKGFYQYLEKNELKNNLFNSLEDKAVRAYQDLLTLSTKKTHMSPKSVFSGGL